MNDARDKQFLVGSFLIIKVLAGKLFFKPYKVTRFFEKEMKDLPMPLVFKDNCLCFGYTLVALFTDYLFDLYKVELERMQGDALRTASVIAEVKQKMFADLMPINDSYVEYKDFASVSSRSEWTSLIESMHLM